MADFHQSRYSSCQTLFERRAVIGWQMFHSPGLWLSFHDNLKHYGKKEASVVFSVVLFDVACVPEDRKHCFDCFLRVSSSHFFARKFLRLTNQNNCFSYYTQCSHDAWCWGQNGLNSTKFSAETYCLFLQTNQVWDDFIFLYMCLIWVWFMCLSFGTIFDDYLDLQCRFRTARVVFTNSHKTAAEMAFKWNFSHCVGVLMSFLDLLLRGEASVFIL